jgi:alpha-1,2-mannosyltransferase
MNIFWSKPGRALFLVFLFCYLTAGIYTELRFIEIKPLPQWLYEDFGYYENALKLARDNKNFYENRSIGTGYLYPPPALFVIELFAQIPTFIARVSLFTTLNITLLLLTIYFIAQKYGYSLEETWWWYLLGVGFAPFLELLHIGQINMITLFAVSMMFFYEKSQPVTSGLWLSLGVITKVTPIIFVIYLFVIKNFKAIISLCVGLIIFAILAGLRYGWEPLLQYPALFSWLTSVFPMGDNSQSVMAKLFALGWISRANAPTWQNVLSGYLLLIIVISSVLTFVKKTREPLFLILSLGVLFSQNILWYHHYVFILLPLFVWMAWSRLNPIVIAWCLLGLMIIQLDRHGLTHGLLILVFGHVSILVILIWQTIQVFPGLRRMRLNILR